MVRIDAERGKVAVDFAYDDAGDWDMTPGTLDAIAERARPR